MAQPPLPPSNGSSIPPRRPVPQQTGGPHSHGQVNHPQYSHSNHGHSHSSNLPLLRTSNHNHGHIHSELDSSSLSSSRFNIDWEAKERELEEARARAAQMEKTMRWWSDCTANWREKWSKVRTERNKAREETKLLRTKLEAALKDCSSMRREKQAAENENDLLRTQMTRFQQQHDVASGFISPCHVSTLDKTTGMGSPEPMWAGEHCDLKAASPIKSERSLSPLSALSPRACLSPQLLHVGHNGMIEIGDPVATNISATTKSATSTLGAVPKLRNTTTCCDTADETTWSPPSSSSSLLLDPIKFLESLEAHDVEFLQQKLTHLKLRLDEATKTIQAEREEKASLHRAMEQLQTEALDMRGRIDELRRSKQDAERQLLAAQDQHHQQVVSLQQDRRDEANTRESLDRRLAELRSELERLQAENAAEWGRRERVETERQALERDNKKLRATLNDFQERLEKRNTCGRGIGGSACGCGLEGGGSGGVRGELEIAQSVQASLDEKTKELLEVRHAHNKLKKALQDKSVELSHGLRRAEHSEAEVRRLRARIDELKREVAGAQDELDASTNTVRKLQRANEELQEHSETLQMQINHLQTRVRNSGSFLSHRESLLQDTLSEDDGNEY